MRGRREARKEKREDRRDNRGTGAKIALGAVAVAGVAYGVKKHREGNEDDGEQRGGGSEDDASSSDDEDICKTFAMREKLLTFGDDFTIEKLSTKRRGGRKGRPAYYADNKVLRVRETFNLREFHDRKVLYSIQERKARVRDSMAIEDEDGNKIAEIKQRKVGVVRDNFVVKIRDETDWQVHGSILEHDFTIKEDGRQIVKVHKKWIAPIKDCYFIDVEQTDDVALALMVVIGLEALTNED